jgi:FAD/FMN-containing dehydrogenase
MNQHTNAGQYHELATSLAGKVVLPEDEAYETGRLAWNLRAHKTPDAIVFPESAQDVRKVLEFARRHDLGVVVQATGHRENVDGRGCILINTARMQDVAIDPRARTAWVAAGAKWGAVLDQAQAHGLAPLLGSSSDVGAVGYTLGGGMGWLARKYGMAVDSVQRFEVVTPDAVIRNASPEENADLFWALCGGGGGFGVVTGMEIRLHPVDRVYAGNLFYGAAMAKDVFRRYREWVADAPDELTCSIVLMNVPPLPELPPEMRGQSFVIVRGCYVGSTALGEELLSHWREWRTPLIDDFRERSFRESDQISQDPVDPLPAMASCEWIRDLSDETADVLISHAFPQGGPPSLIFCEVRLAGGAISRVAADANAFSHRDERFICYAVGVAPSDEAASQYRQHLGQLRAALGPARTGKIYMNFIEGDELRGRTRDGYSEQALGRLQAVKARYDPDGRIVSGFEFSPPAGG